MTRFARIVVALAFAAAVAVFLAGARRSPGIRLEVAGDGLAVHLRGRDSILAVARTVRLPLALIESITAAPRRSLPQSGWRLPGTVLPGVLRAGSYGRGGQRDFWLVRRADAVLVIAMRPGAE